VNRAGSLAERQARAAMAEHHDRHRHRFGRPAPKIQADRRPQPPQLRFAESRLAESLQTVLVGAAPMAPT